MPEFDPRTILAALRRAELEVIRTRYEYNKAMLEVERLRKLAVDLPLPRKP